MKKIIIFGAGGFAREVADAIRRINQMNPTYHILGFIDNREDLQGTEMNEIPVLGGDDFAIEMAKKETLYGVLGLSSAKIKRAIVKKMGDLIQWEKIVDPTGCISPSAKIGKGSVIQPFVFIGANTEIGNHCMINPGSCIGHDVMIDDYVSIMSCCDVAGDVHLREDVYLGSSVSVIQGLHICEGVTVGAGATVVKSVEGRGTNNSRHTCQSVAEKRTLHIGYFADGPWAHRAFDKLVRDKNIVIDFVCLRYDNRDSILEQKAKTNNIEVFCEENINSEAFVEKMKQIKSDLFVSMSFNQIFKKEMIELPAFKTINCHAGKLPYYRGRNVLNWVLINDEKEFGITVHYMDEGIDTGDIILQEVYPITDEDDYGTLLDTAYIGCAELLYKAIKLIQAGKVTLTNQASIDRIGLYCGKRQAGDEIINWNQTSRQIFNFVRALTKPGVGAISYIDSEEVKIFKTELIEDAKEYIGIPGQVIKKDDGEIFVKTKDTMIKVVDYQCDNVIHIGDRFQNCIE